MEGDVAPFVADMGGGQLKESGGHGIVILVRLEKERGETIGVVAVCTEDEDTSEELNWEGVYTLGRKGRHGS